MSLIQSIHYDFLAQRVEHVIHSKEVNHNFICMAKLHDCGIHSFIENGTLRVHKGTKIIQSKKISYYNYQYTRLVDNVSHTLAW